MFCIRQDGKAFALAIVTNKAKQLTTPTDMMDSMVAVIPSSSTDWNPEGYTWCLPGEGFPPDLVLCGVLSLPRKTS